jgi:coenzyme F420 hydrogenase subunit beta
VTRTLTYDESWGEILQAHRQWRCYVCADHTGEFADVAVGDPWYHPPDGSDPGRSLVIARTPLGQQMIEQAISAGYLTLTPAAPSMVPRSQPELLRVRGSVWGRIWVSRLLGAAAPRYVAMPTFRFWLRTLDFRQKLQSTLGTVRRVLRKRLRHPIAIEQYTPADRTDS